MKTSKIKMTTVANAMSSDQLFDLINQLDEVLLPMGSCNKEEQGEFFEDFEPEDSDDIWEGHAISYNVGKKNVFFAMAHSNTKSYLVRADENLIQVGK